LVSRLSEPSILQSLEELIERLPTLEKGLARLEQLPEVAGVLGDVFDEWAAGLSRQGIDLEKAVRQGLHAALWLGQRVSERELERLGILLRSDVLEPHALAVVGKTGRALATCHEGACATPVPERLGPLGLLRALNDPDVQRALAFGVQAARCFGSHVDEPGAISVAGDAV
jgi:hypothetical protein